MPALVKSRSRSKERYAFETELISSEKQTHHYNTMASELLLKEYVGGIHIAMKRARYLQKQIIILFAILIKTILAYIKEREDLIRQVNTFRCNAKIVSSFRSTLDSFSLAGKTSRLQQKKLSPAADLDSPCAGSWKYDDKQDEGISSKAGRESYDVISKNTDNKYMFNMYDCLEYVIKIKQCNYLYQDTKSEVVRQQDTVRHAGFKTDTSQDHRHVQIVADLTQRYKIDLPNYRNVSPSSGSGSTHFGSRSTSSGSGSTSSGSRSTSSGSRSTNSGSGSTSPGSGSTNSGSGSTRSGSGSTSSGSGSTSSGSASPGSGNHSPSFGCALPSSESGPTCSGSWSPSSRSYSPSSGSGSPSSGTGSTSSWNGSNHSGNGSTSCDLSEPLYAISCSRTEQLSECIKETTSENSRLHGSDVQSLTGLTEHDIVSTEDIALGTSCPYELQLTAGIECSTWVLPCGIQDILNTSTDERCKQIARNLRKTVIEDSSRNNDSDKLFLKIGNDELSLETPFDELSHTTAYEREMSCFQDKSWCSHSEIPGKRTSLLPDVYSQPKLNYQFEAIDDPIARRKSLLAIVVNEDCEKHNETSEPVDVECLIDPVSESKKKEVGEIFHHKCHLATYRNEDFDIDNEFPEPVDVEYLIEPVDESKKREVGEITHDKCHLATYRHEDCDKGTESSETEVLIEPVVDCKKSEAGVAVEQEVQPNTNKNSNAVLSYGKYGKKQHAENVQLKINDGMTESLSQRTQHQPDFSNLLKSFFSAYQFEFHHEKSFIKSKSKPRDREAESPNLCTCLHRHRCFHNKPVSRFSIVESEGQDPEHALGSRFWMKFDPSRDMPWRYINEVFNQTISVAPSSLYIFMNFEVFRLLSFNLKKFPKDASSFVTHLAKSGFYFITQSVQIVCFGCGSQFEGSQDSSPSSAESFHNPSCTRHVSNQPIDQWAQGLNLDALTEYFLQNGSLTPYLEETSAVGDSSSRRATSKNVLEAKPISDLPPYTDDYSSGYESEGLQYVESERETRSDAQLLLTDSSLRTIHEYPSINHSCSLPSDLNHISGVVVCEERLQPEGSQSVLTSATRRPLLYRSTTSSNAEHGDEAVEEGAVGGALTLNLDGASYPHFSIEAVRLKSFIVWSPQHSHKPEDLAAAGFFYAGYSDCVRCFYCGLGLKYWRPTDIPAYQHAKYRPHCLFNILYKGQDYVDKVQQELHPGQDATNRVEALPAAAQPQESVQTTINSQVSGDPQEQDYLSSEAAKEALRNGWTREQVRQAVNHVVNVYGESCLEGELLTDILTHFNTLNQDLLSNSSAGSNDSGINSTVPQLTTSHPSSSTLLNALPARDDIQDRHQDGQGRHQDGQGRHQDGQGRHQDGQGRHQADQRTQEGATPVSTSHGEQPGVRVPDFMEILTSVEREHSLLEERVTCRVCRSRPVGCIYLPCGHVIACQECADNATHCVFCTKVIIGTANIFLA